MDLPSPSDSLTGTTSDGLSEEEARKRLEATGPNSVTLPEPSPGRLLLAKFWGPVPWMLETAFLLELATGKDLEALIVILLLLMNGLLAFLKEEKGKAALRLLRNKMEVTARVRRDGLWKTVPAREIVPGDLVHIRQGDFVPADLLLDSGTPLLDQSSLTGESLPVPKSPGDSLFAGTVVRRGEGTGRVIRTGKDCAFGRTVQLVHDAETRSHAEVTVLQIVRSLLLTDLLLALVIIPLSLRNGLSLSAITAFILILLISAIPIALPPMFTLANALSALTLGRREVLVTRLSAISDAAAMEELICDKTGTLTENRLAVLDVSPVSGHSERELLQRAMDASDAATMDPLDLAILVEGRRRGLLAGPESSRLSFTPFDPSTKRTEALLDESGTRIRVVKGSPPLLSALGLLTDTLPPAAPGGQRPVAVLAGPEKGPLHLLGVLSFSDPLRQDSRQTLDRLRDLGVRIRLATGDTPEAAIPVARALGLSGTPCSGKPEPFREDCDLFAGILPEDKFLLVRRLQEKGRIVGMTGDGVNDAPALRQAEVGIAVARSTDIARASAGLVLLSPGLSGLVEVVLEGRRVTRRLQSYILNKIVKTLEIAFFLTGGLLLLHTAVIGSRQILLLIFTNDFVTMALASDRVSISERPDILNIRQTMVRGFLFAALWLLLTFFLFRAGQTLLHLSPEKCQTLSFLTLVLTGIGNVLVIRHPGPMLKSPPSRTLLLILGADILVAGVLSGTPFLLSPLPLPVIGGVLGIVGVTTLAIEGLKSFKTRPRRAEVEEGGLISGSAAPKGEK